MSKDIEKNHSGYNGGAKLSETVLKNALYCHTREMYFHRSKYKGICSYKVYKMKTPKGGKMKKPFMYKIDKNGRIDYTLNGKRTVEKVSAVYESIAESTTWGSKKFNVDKLPMETFAMEDLDRGEVVRHSILKCSSEGRFYSKDSPNIALPMKNGLTWIGSECFDGAKEYWFRKLFLKTNKNIRKKIEQGKKNYFNKPFKPNIFIATDVRRIITSVKVMSQMSKNKPTILSESNSSLLHPSLEYLIDEGGMLAHVRLDIGSRFNKKSKTWSPDWSEAIIVSRKDENRTLFKNRDAKMLHEFEKNKWLLTVDLTMKKDDAKKNSMNDKERLDYESSFKSDGFRTIPIYNGRTINVETKNIMIGRDEINKCKILPYTNKLKELGMKKMSTYKAKKPYIIESIFKNGGLVNLYVGRDRETNLPYMYGFIKRNKRNVYLELWEDANGDCTVDGVKYNIEQELFKKEHGYKDVFYLKDVDIEIISKDLVEGDKKDFENLIITDNGTIVTRENLLIFPEKENSDRGPVGITIINGAEIYGPALFVRAKHGIGDKENTVCFTKDFKSKYSIMDFREIDIMKDAIRAHPSIDWNATKVSAEIGFGDTKHKVESFVIKPSIDESKSGLLGFDVYWRESGKLIEPESYETKDSTTGEMETFAYYDVRIRVPGLNGRQRFRFTSFDMFYN